ncbi:MAG: hypothetical protein R3290_12540 [Acidimicrobiia bacterium]|nr:hypothetical protein [Acidimicrobiia bacterium]
MTQRAIDWGVPKPADWPGPRERITARIPVDLAEALRARARREGVSFNTFLQRVFEEEIGVRQDPIPETLWYDGYNPFR